METLPLPLRSYDDIEFSKGLINQTDKLICNSWRKENRQGKRKRDGAPIPCGARRDLALESAGLYAYYRCPKTKTDKSETVWVLIPILSRKLFTLTSHFTI
jgi:hypothetical protein